MKQSLIVSLFFIQAINTLAQMPNTDIWLMDIKTENGKTVVSNPVNVTNRKGYDNQPAFSPDGTYFLFSSMPDEKQTDIYKYDLQTKTITQLTQTNTSEYSPTFMLDGKNISVVMVEPDSTQRVWKFPLNGGEASLVLKGIKEVGYHCWLDPARLGLFLITKPFKGVIADIYTEKSVYLKDSIGRSMHLVKSEEGNRFFFLHKDSIFSTDINGNKIHFESLKKLKGEDLAFNGENIIMGEDTKLFENIRWLNRKKRTANWVEMIDLSGYGIKKITRITISPDKTKMAIVAESN